MISLFLPFPPQELGNSLDKCKNNENLQQILTNATIMVVSVTASTTQGYVYHMVRGRRPATGQLAAETRKGRMGCVVRVVLAENYGPWAVRTWNSPRGTQTCIQSREDGWG